MTKKKNISQEDINIWQKYIKNPNDITDKDQPHKNKKLNIYRFKYDLHGYTLVEANINANNAFISGKVKGNIIVKGKIEITGTAIILGNIKAQIVSIESGALIKGDFNMPVGNITVEEPRPEVKPIKLEEEKNK